VLVALNQAVQPNQQIITMWGILLPIHNKVAVVLIRPDTTPTHPFFKTHLKHPMIEKSKRIDNVPNNLTESNLL
jgi:hypothetical protein